MLLQLQAKVIESDPNTKMYTGTKHSMSFDLNHFRPFWEKYRVKIFCSEFSPFNPISKVILLRRDTRMFQLKSKQNSCLIHYITQFCSNC